MYYLNNCGYFLQVFACRWIIYTANLKYPIYAKSWLDRGGTWSQRTSANASKMNSRGTEI